MAVVELFVTGDEIGLFTSYSVSGKSNGTKVTLEGVETFGSITDTFRIVVSNVEDGQTAFTDGQLVEVYPWPDTDPPSEPLYSSLNPDHTAFNGRASSDTHQIIFDENGTGLVIYLDGIDPTLDELQIGPGIDPPRELQLEFVSLPNTPPVIPCFTPGTLIEAESGPLPIEVLTVGDLVRTMDHGLQPIRWIGQRRVAGTGTMAPVRIAAGAMGNYREMLVSPQHRMLIAGHAAQMHFGMDELLVAAKHLVDGRRITQNDQAEVTYIHLLFDRHEVIFAEGAPTESLHLGQMGEAALDRAARDEIMTLFPELAAPTLPHSRTARHCLKAWEAAVLRQGSVTGVLSPAA